MSNHQKNMDDEEDETITRPKNAGARSFTTAVSERLRKDKIENSKCCCWLGVAFGMALIIAGSVLVPFGLRDEKEALALDPEADFFLLDEPCSIDSHVYVESNQKRCCEKSGDSTKCRDCGCEDVYYYVFDAMQLVDEEGYDYIGSGYQSDFFTVDRLFTKSCDNSSPKLPPWEQGEQVQCWRPSQPGVALPRQYQCGNEDCIKIFDPQQDKDEAHANAVRMRYGGLVTFVVAFICIFCIAAPSYWKLRKARREQKEANKWNESSLEHQLETGYPNVQQTNPTENIGGPITYYK